LELHFDLPPLPCGLGGSTNVECFRLFVLKKRLSSSPSLLVSSFPPAHPLHVHTHSGRGRRLRIFCRANFEFDLGGGGAKDGPSQRREGQIKPKPKPDTTCAGIHQDLSLWISSLRASGPVSKFLQRQITCLAVICLLYVIREALRKLQMLIYSDDPPPPDMAFPVLQCWFSLSTLLPSVISKSRASVALQADA
jgi:hypothetical protein